MAMRDSHLWTLNTNKTTVAQIHPDHPHTLTRADRNAHKCNYEYNTKHTAGHTLTHISYICEFQYALITTNSMWQPFQASQPKVPHSIRQTPTHTHRGAVHSHRHRPASLQLTPKKRLQKVEKSNSPPCSLILLLLLVNSQPKLKSATIIFRFQTSCSRVHQL